MKKTFRYQLSKNFQVVEAIIELDVDSMEALDKKLEATKNLLVRELNDVVERTNNIGSTIKTGFTGVNKQLIKNDMAYYKNGSPAKSKDGIHLTIAEYEKSKANSLKCWEMPYSVIKGLL